MNLPVQFHVFELFVRFECLIEITESDVELTLGVQLRDERTNGRFVVLNP
jgi:hypothetical protein